MKKLMMAAMVVAATMVATADDYGFTYQAELKNDKGQALSSRNQTVEIRLWKTATGTSEGDLLWGRTYNIYTDENGLFNQEISDSLGSRTSDDPNVKLSKIFCDNGAGTVYLGLKVKDSAGEITPRQRLFAVPFAGRANGANNLVGNSHNVEGALNLPGGSSLSASGLNLAASSTTTVGVFTAESVTSKGDLSAGNITFTGKVTDAVGSEVVPVPVGGIIMWTQSSLPDNEHWAICDGSEKNGITTPNLSGRFIVGVGKSSSGGTTYGYGQNGGEETHKLTTDEMPAHSHEFGQDINLNKVDGYTAGKSIGGTGFASSDSSDVHLHPYDAKSTGGDKAHENRPPYYALYYIMRVK